MPDLGHNELYRQFRLDEPWNSPHNTQLLAQIPPAFQSPERFDDKTNYLGVAGTGQALGGTSGIAPGAIKDGLANTLVVVEVDEERAAFWTAPEEFVAAADAPRSGLGGLRSDGVFVLLGHGQVMRVGPDLPDDQFLALLSVAGGEPVVAARILHEATPEPAEIRIVSAAAPLVTPAPQATSDLPDAVPPEPSASAPAAPAAATPAIARPAAPSPIAGAVDANRIAVPPEESLAAARDLFREVYGKEYDEARKWEDKAKLAQRLLAEAAKVEKNPAHYHELLRIARDVAVAGGDADSAFKAVTLLGQRFQFDELPMRLKVLEGLSKSPRKTGSAERLREEARKLLDEAFDADQFEVALAAHLRLVEFTRLKGDRAEITRVTQRKQSLEAASQAYAAARAAEEVLEANPSDSAASEMLGKYLCFVKNRWTDGLPHLVRSEDVKLRVVAAIDLEASRSPQATLSLAEQYWEMAGERKQPQARGLHLRAVHHYQTAIVLLDGGLERLKAQKRIDEAGEQYGKDEVQKVLAAVPVRPASTMD